MPDARTERFCVADTQLGPVGLAWRGSALTAIQLPCPTREETRAAIGSGREAACPPPGIEATVLAVRQHLAGQPPSYEGVEIDLTRASDFEKKVYHETRTLAAGQTCTYGQLAARLGKPGASRAVGGALGRNPTPLVIPCHRVLSTSSRAGGFSAPGGLGTKFQLLALEGVGRDGGPLPGDLWSGATREAAVEHLCRNGLGPVVERVGPFTLKREYPDDPFAALGEAVLYQQLAGSAAATIVRRLVSTFGGRFPRPETLLTTSPERLRDVGISAPKARALRELSAAVAAGRLHLKLLPLLPDDEVVREITALKGLGPWTARMFLMFHLGRPDVLPTADLGIRKAAARLFGLRELPPASVLERRAKPWRPYRTVASWYLWRSLGTVTLG